MLVPVTFARLQELVNYFCIVPYPYYEELREFMKLLRISGIRYQEAFDISRWALKTGNDYYLQPQKKNSLRVITLDSDFLNFKNAISGQYSPFLGRTFSQANNLFDRVKNFNHIYSGEKEIRFYIFRYYFVRYLDSLGYTLEQIKTIMGYADTSPILNYLNADLQEDVTIPPFSNIKYGRLYNGYTAINSNFAPTGWHVPTMYDIWNLVIFIDPGASQYNNTVGGHIKSVGYSYWEPPNTDATDTYQFNFRGAGKRNYQTGNFEALRYHSYIFSSSVVYSYYLAAGYCSWNEKIFRCFKPPYFGVLAEKNIGHSIRLIKNDSNDPSYLIGNDNTVYKTIKIGTQVWMAENSAETLLRDGTPIPNLTNNNDFINAVTPARCDYNNDPTNVFM